MTVVTALYNVPNSLRYAILYNYVSLVIQLFIKNSSKMSSNEYFKQHVFIKIGGNWINYGINHLNAKVEKKDVNFFCIYSVWFCPFLKKLIGRCWITKSKCPCRWYFRLHIILETGNRFLNIYIYTTARQNLTLVSICST